MENFSSLVILLKYFSHYFPCSFFLQKELTESCQDHELINLMKVEPVPAEQGMILIKTNRIFCLLFSSLASPNSNITVGKKGLHRFSSLLFVS